MGENKPLIKTEKLGGEFGIKNTVAMLAYVRQNPALWSKDAALLEDPKITWNKIAEKLGLDVGTVRRRYLSIRTSYRDYLLRCESNRKRNKCLPSFCWKEHMSFLKNQLEEELMIKSTGNISFKTVPSHPPTISSTKNKENVEDSIFEVIEDDDDYEGELFEVSYKGFDLLDFMDPIESQKRTNGLDLSDNNIDFQNCSSPRKMMKFDTSIKADYDNDFVKIAKTFTDYDSLSAERQIQIKYELRKLILRFEEDLLTASK